MKRQYKKGNTLPSEFHQLSMTCHRMIDHLRTLDNHCRYQRMSLEKAQMERRQALSRLSQKNCSELVPNQDKLRSILTKRTRHQTIDDRHKSHFQRSLGTGSNCQSSHHTC
jgi:hypothetical protein